jgi:hypothetical protein
VANPDAVPERAEGPHDTGEAGDPEVPEGSGRAGDRAP